MPHALLLIGPSFLHLESLRERFDATSPDVRLYEGMRMSIDEARLLIKEAFLTPVASSHRTFVLSYTFLTDEAQNALLKLLEEPPLTARFYLIVPGEQVLLPTLRSRLVLGEVAYAPSVTAESFFKKTHAERLAVIAHGIASKDPEWATTFMKTIEREAHAEQYVDVLREIDTFRRSFDLTGASRKMILEHIALSR